MIVCNNISELRKAVAQVKSKQQRLGFVPTMGNLHQGHLALVKRAQQACDAVVASIFVNPLQFNNSNDLANYPRTVEADLNALEQAGVAIAFLPKAEEIYPQGLAAETKVIVPDLADILEGALRPGHFTGVSTIVCKLFNLVQPDIAVFGEKDYQQLAIIRKMTQDLLLPIEIISLPTVREASGLAMSSRNGRLSDAQKQLAPALAKAMHQLAANLQREQVQQQVQDTQAQLEQLGFVCDGIDLVDAKNLRPLNAHSQQAVILVAAFLGDVRLIDNCVVELKN